MRKETKEVLKGYIKDCLNRGFNREEIISHIEKKGFDKEEIEDLTHLTYHKDSNSFFMKALIFLIPFLLLVLVNIVFKINIPAIIFIVVLTLTLLAVLSADKDTKRMLFLTLTAFLISEIVLIRYDVETGIVLYSVFLAFLILALIFRKFKPEVREALFIMMILPLTRLIGSLLPIENFSFPLRLTSVYLLMLITSFIIMRSINPDKMTSSRYMGLLPLAFIIGMFFGWIEYLILRPAPVFEYLNIDTLFLGISIMGLTGFTEEFIFRGLLQNHLLKSFNIFTAIMLSNLIFVSMHLIWLNLVELIFVFFIGLLCAVVYHKTKNLILISVFHGMINFSLFVFSPLLG